MKKETYIIKKHIIGIGCVYAESGDAEMIAYAIGSCIALCLYDYDNAIGAMAHILLPSASFSGHKNNSIDVSTRYADHALYMALAKMYKLGANKTGIKAAIIGGAEMYPHGSAKIINIGKMNTASVTEELIKYHIPICYSEVGGEKSRTVIFKIPGKSFKQQIVVKSPPPIK